VWPMSWVTSLAIFMVLLPFLSVQDSRFGNTTKMIGISVGSKAWFTGSIDPFGV
jgi:hypothetical protein